MLSIHGRIVYQRPMPTVVASAYQQGNCYELLYVEEFLLPRLIVLQGRLVRAIDGWQLDHIVQWLDRDESSSHEESPGQGCARQANNMFHSVGMQRVVVIRNLACRKTRALSIS
jgi:hypothetical protein